MDVPEGMEFQFPPEGPEVPEWPGLPTSGPTCSTRGPATPRPSAHELGDLRGSPAADLEVRPHHHDRPRGTGPRQGTRGTGFGRNGGTWGAQPPAGQKKQKMNFFQKLNFLKVSHTNKVQKL